MDNRPKGIIVTRIPTSCIKCPHLYDNKGAGVWGLCYYIGFTNEWNQYILHGGGAERFPYCPIKRANGYIDANGDVIRLDEETQK